MSGFVATSTLVVHSQLGGLPKERFLYVIGEVEPDVERFSLTGRHS